MSGGHGGGDSSHGTHDVSLGDNTAYRGSAGMMHPNEPSPAPGPVGETEEARHHQIVDSPEFCALRDRLHSEALAIIAQYEDSRSGLIPIIHRFQEEEGYVSQSAMRTTAEWLGLPVAIVESTVSFYTLFFRKPVGKYMLQVCRNLSCSINGAEEIMTHFRERLGINHLETTDDGLFSYEEVECLAACDRAPCMQVNLDFVYDLTPDMIDAMLAGMRAGAYAATRPLMQTVKPGRSWHVAQDTGKKSKGAWGVSNPNAPGGIGDASGRAALRRIVDEVPAVGLRTRERLVREGQAGTLHEGGSNERH
jgi:NADH-quinone oxidoreductase E subunit